MNHKYLGVLILSGSLAVAPAAFAGTGATNNSNNPPTGADLTFADAAARANLAEVQLGKLAEERGTTQTVKDFGKRMVTDHTKADDQLKTVAKEDNVNLPTMDSKADQATYNELSKLSGTAFDKAYARDMVRDHTGDIAMFQREAQDGKNASIKNYASETLPTLQEHLKLAKQMESSVSSAYRVPSNKKQS